MIENYFWDVRFPKFIFKQILGQKLNIYDITEFQPTFANNLFWLMDHDVTELGLSFKSFSYYYYYKNFLTIFSYYIRLF